MKRLLFTTLASCLMLASIVVAQTSESRRILAIIGPSIVKVTGSYPDGKTFTCTGFVIRPRQVMTAAHCIKDDKDKQLPVAVDGRPSTIVKVDEWLALLYSEDITKPPLVVAKDPMQIGDLTYAFGFGFDIPTILIRPVIWIIHSNKIFQDNITVDGMFIQGMSGGPLVDDKGRVVGVVQKSDTVMGMASGPGAIKAFLP